MREGVRVLAIVVAIVLILVGARVSQPPHEVHTPGAGALNPRSVGSDPPVISAQAIQPSQSLNDVRCAVWRARHPQTAVCPDAATLASMYFLKLTQSPSTLYVPSLWCVYTQLYANGCNMEYQPGRRAVVIHCYLTNPLLRQGQTSYAYPQPWLSLLLVPTSSIPAGQISVIEADPIEHLLGDQTTDHQLATPPLPSAPKT